MVRLVAMSIDTIWSKRKKEKKKNVTDTNDNDVDQPRANNTNRMIVRYEPAGLARQSVSRVTTMPILAVDLLTCDLVATDNVGTRPVIVLSVLGPLMWQPVLTCFTVARQGRTATN